jgi:phage shock protein A
MTLMTRFSRLFRADLHAVLDRLEEPDVLLRQALREMEQSLLDGRRQLKAQELERQHLRSRRSQAESGAGDSDAQLDLCFAAGNTELARTLLRRKLEGERLAAWLERRIATLDASITELAASLEEQARQLQRLRDQAAVFESEAGQETHPGAGDELQVRDADVELALLREQRRRA